MVVDSGKQWRKAAMEGEAPPPPRSLDVRRYAEARASDLESLNTIISSRLNHDFRSCRNKRRRTTSYNNNPRRHHSQKPKKSDDDDEKNQKLPRRVRRRIELKQNPHTGFSVSGDSTRRLRTHVWHAKRFMVTKLWGFYLPLGIHGRGKGSRALLKHYKHGVVVHDASYYTAVQLEAPQDSLLSILSTLLVPSPIDYLEDFSNSIISGQTYASAMLHYARHDGSKAICPVTYMWRPSQLQQNDVDMENKGPDENIDTSLGSHFRRLWIWMHPSALGVGFDCLKLACQKKMDETGVLVNCVSLDGKLGKLEVMGSGASQLLQRMLHLSNKLSMCIPPKRVLQPCTSSHLEDLSNSGRSMEEDKYECGSKQNIIKMTEYVPSDTVASLAVVDPRLKRTSAVPEADLSEDKMKDHSERILHMKEEELSILLSKHRTNSSFSQSKDLWDAIEGTPSPMEENLLCLERHKKSLDLFCLKDTTSAKSMSTQTQFSTLCPILLLRNTDHTGHLTGWSIILPLNWVKAFWIPLVSGGAHAIGLREKHWIACDVGLPCFPSDFPDCNAYSSFMEKEAAEVEKKMELRTPDLRPLKVPMPPPWTSISFGIDVSSKKGSHEDHSADLHSEISDIPPVNSSGPGCTLFVARTSRMLASFLKEISCDHLLLYPKGPARKSFSHFMKDEARLAQATLTNHRRRLCYLRVLLHAYTKGVFDEGAVVCAPRFCDLSLWTSRSENDEAGLQIPDAFLGSYFKQLSNGEWEFQLPEDPVAMEAYRIPIGFVTTGFTRGSKRPSAVALCEAVKLAHLRQEQWSRLPAKKRRKEIFVLVRNLRSTAYRLALASIILEEQEEDVKSL